jgi:hypothetical protein
MWLQLGLASGAALIVFAVLRAFRRRSPEIDVGPVSDAWLAEQRARGRESE